MKKIFALVLVIVLLVIPVTNALAGGFDEFGYNDVAHIFNGKASGWCLAGGQSADCMGIYTNDNLIMKWNEAWDECNAHGYDDPTYCAGAWTSNEWNGMNPDGSQSVWHYKMIWVGSAGESSIYWMPGGYSIWGNYEVIQDFGFDPTGHYWYAHARPNGYGLGN